MELFPYSAKTLRQVKLGPLKELNADACGQSTMSERVTHDCNSEISECQMFQALLKSFKCSENP